MRLNDSDLLSSLHEGMFEQPLWQSFLEKLRRRTESTATSLIFHSINDENAIVRLHAGKALPDDFPLLFPVKSEPGIQPRQQMREGRVYSLTELIDPDPALRRVIRNEPTAAPHMRYGRCVRITEPSGITGWLSIFADEEFSAATSARLLTLVPHVRIALRGFVALERERFRSAVTARAIQRLNFGWMTLDAQCRIVDHDEQAERLLERSDRLKRGRYNRLTPTSPDMDREISALIRSCARGEQERPKAINIQRDPWLDMLVAPFQDRSTSSGTAPVAIIYLRGDSQSNTDRHEQLVDLFGLLPSEARLAWAMAQGLSISEAAQELGLSVETARNYSKKIYAKTGSRGQAELVRTLLTSVLALA